MDSAPPKSDQLKLTNQIGFYKTFVGSCRMPLLDPIAVHELLFANVQSNGET